MKEIQARLKALGYDPGPVDGVYGGQTEKAIRAFQTDRGLKVDGKVGPQTNAALFPAATGVVKGLITAEVIRAICPGARADIVEGIASRPDQIAAAGIITKMRAAHFLAQCAHESAGFTTLEESLNYSVDGLLKTFSRSRISAADAARYGRSKDHPANQEAIANIVYGGEFGRRELGNTQPGDGWRYRGSGIKQNTGRANHRAAGYENDPEGLRKFPGALDAALVFWMDKGLAAYADRDDIEGMTRRVNGGTNGLAQRKAYLAKAKKALGV